MPKIPWIVILLLTSVLLIVFFNFNYVKEIIKPELGKVAINDGVVAEFLTENSYQNFLKFQNPFSKTDKLFYPFGINYSLNDTLAANLIPLLILRPFFDIHRSTLIILLLNLFLANVFMYILLRKLKITNAIAFLVSLVFGFTPVISYKVLSHYTYTTIYLFPLIFLVILYFINAKSSVAKLLTALLLGLLLVLTYFANAYYFIMIGLGIIFYSVYYLFTSFRLFITFIKNNIIFLLISLFTFMFLMLPWFIKVMELIYYEGQSKVSGFAGAIELSADVLNFITPSEYNPFYKYIIQHFQNSSTYLTKIAHFYFYNGYKIAYPGLIILITYLFITIKILKKKLSLKPINNIKPHFLASILFALLTLGPFLKVFNHFMLFLDEGIPVVFPLPFLILHYLPGFSTMRAPARFITAFVFFACIVTAYIINKYYLKTDKRKRILFLLIFFVIFLFDQFYAIPNRLIQNIPLKAYNYIKNDPEKSTVLEIPFTVRDGLDYIGFVHATPIMKGTLIHDKPIIGGYLARVNPYIFNYYKNLPFIGNIAPIIDKGNYDINKEKPREPVISPFTSDLQMMEDELTFLNIKYVLLKENETYTSIIKDNLTSLGFTVTMKDRGYILYEKKLIKKNFDKIQFGSENDNFYIGQGFSKKEDGFRWAEDKIAKVFIKTYDLKKKNLVFEAETFSKSQEIKIFLNKDLIGTKNISVEKNKYSLDVSNKLTTGLNTIIFKFSQSYKPSQVLSKSRDERNLAIKFYTLKIE